MLAETSTPTPTKPVRIVIADDHPILVDGFCFALRKHKEVEVAGTACNGEQLVKLVQQLQPDIAFTDIKMPVMDGITAAKEIRERFPGVKVIAFTGFMDDCFITDMMIEAKASGYLLKEAHKKEILMAIEKVSSGQIYCSGEVLQRLVVLAQRTSTNPVKPFSKPDFTEREMTIMAENARGLSSKEIAQKQNIKPGAVESAKRRLFEKTNCRNSLELAAYAFRNFIAPL